MRREMKQHFDCDSADRIEVYDVYCGSWGKFRSEVNELVLDTKKPLGQKEWIFRGMLKQQALKTTLERACDHWKIALDHLPEIEVELIREIERKAFGLGIPLPSEVDRIWWVSLMQHHGAPTRLLDFTYSPYIAAYFACEKLLRHSEAEEAAVWAMQHDFTQAGGRHVADRALLDKIENAENRSLDFLFDPTRRLKPSVTQVNAHYLHDRVTVQQGLFLCPTNVSVPFMRNLASVPGYSDQTLVKRLILPRNVIGEAAEELQKMNITRYSLFPGIGGLAKSLTFRLPYFDSLAQYRASMTSTRRSQKGWYVERDAS